MSSDFNQNMSALDIRLSQVSLNPSRLISEIIILLDSDFVSDNLKEANENKVYTIEIEIFCLFNDFGMSECCYVVWQLKNRHGSWNLSSLYTKWYTTHMHSACLVFFSSYACVIRISHPLTQHKKIALPTITKWGEI